MIYIVYQSMSTIEGYKFYCTSLSTTDSPISYVIFLNSMFTQL